MAINAAILDPSGALKISAAFYACINQVTLRRIVGAVSALGIIFFTMCASPALSQNAVLQSGTITPSHSPYWVSQGIIGDGGTANDSPITSFGVTSNTNAGLCISTGRASAAGRQQLCLGTTLTGPARLSLQNYGTAVAQDLQLVVNGNAITIPSSGGAIPAVILPLVNTQPICASGTTGALGGCAGSTNAIPYWTSSTVQGVIAAAANSVLVTNGSNVPSLSQTIPTAVQGNITALGTIATGTWNGSAVGAAFGGTGLTTITANGVMIGNGTSAITTASTASIGLCLISNGTGSPPTFQSCSAGSGSAGGSNTQVQFNNATALGGSPNFTWVSPALTIGLNASATGQLVLANGGGSGQSVTIQNPTTTSAYNFNLPTGAGTSGQPLLSGGGGSTAMTFGTLGVAGGGTACSVASGTCLDNISGFSSTGFINRTGAGTYAFSSTIGLINGGTGSNITATSGGIPYFSSSSGMASSAAMGSGQIILGGGTGASPTTSANASIATGALTLGQAGSAAGSVILAGATSGTATVRVAAAAGTGTIFELPANNGTASQVLQTDGNGVTSWVAAAGGGTVTSVAAGTGMSFSSITSSGSVAIDKATAGNLQAATSNKVLTTDIVYTSETTTTYGATTTFDLNTFINTVVTLTGNITTVTMNNIKAGQCGNIRFIQDGTGSRTLPATFNANFKFAGGTQPVLTTTASAVDVMPFCCTSTNYCVASLIKNVQ